MGKINMFLSCRIIPLPSDREIHMKHRGTKFSQWLLSIFLITVIFLSFFSIFLHPYNSSANRRKPYTIDALDHDFPYSNCSMRVIDTDVRSVLLAFANKYKLNIIMSEEVKGSISIIVNDISVKEAFKNILHYSDLGYTKEKNVYRIKPLESIIKEEKLNSKTENLITEVIPLKYASAQRLGKNLSEFKSKLPETIIKADKWTNSIIVRDTVKRIEEIKDIINRLDISTPPKKIEEFEKASKIIKLRYINCADVAKIKSFKEKISTHPQTNSIIITDIPENIPQIASIIRNLDKPIRQVLIEAKIVETNKKYCKSFGIQWGGHYSASPASGKNFPSVLMGGSLGENNYAVNLPSSGEALGSLNFILGHLQNKAALNLRLSAMEDSGNGRIISQPRIMTLDNNKAEISTGHSIHFPNSAKSEISINTDNTAKAEQTNPAGSSSSSDIPTETAETKLVVTPHIISDNQIKLNIEINRETPDYSHLEQDNPILPFITRAAKTVLIIKDEETAVIGGMAITETDENSQKIPWFSQIPLIGWLFKNKRKISNYEELLVFITPHIIQPPEYSHSEEKRR